jgi:hypothetical protein
MTADVTRFADTTLFGDTTFFQMYVDLLTDGLVTGSPTVGEPGAIIFSVLIANDLITGQPYFMPVVFNVQGSGSAKIAFLMDVTSRVDYLMIYDNVELIMDVQQEVLIGGE